MNAMIGIAILSAIVVVHEMGHLLMAKYRGVDVTRFSLGFGPVVIHLFNWNETEFVVSLVPLGGYIQLEAEGGFENIDLKSRAYVAAAGPIANVIAAGILGSLALGFMSNRWDIFPVFLVVGILLATVLTLVSIPLTVLAILGVFGLDAVGGPVTVVNMLGTPGETMAETLLMVAIMNTSIASFNLLPFPFLDGGHLFDVFVNIHPRWRKTYSIVKIIGAILLVVAMLEACGNDIYKLLLR